MLGSLQKHIRYTNEKSYILTARVEQAEFVAAVSQAENLPPWVKHPIPEAFKYQIDGDTILNYIY